ncbi:MAG: hypothetical protein Q8S21_03160 [Candidatus Paracaedibacteraceae bacterium]|nr:hypothetical protein [Candidatus Paracaedibacteraceae bacterium]
MSVSFLKKKCWKVAKYKTHTLSLMLCLNAFCATSSTPISIAPVTAQSFNFNPLPIIAKPTINSFAPAAITAPLPIMPPASAPTNTLITPTLVPSLYQPPISSINLQPQFVSVSPINIGSSFNLAPASLPTQTMIAPPIIDLSSMVTGIKPPEPPAKEASKIPQPVKIIYGKRQAPPLLQYASKNDKKNDYAQPPQCVNTSQSVF